jgi:2,4-dienoyl-CoA reductase-like NADH-dependent reductase (Old Yellow Enzyme family)/pyruvate/2-oxoglutarate dehydrogenase complex dihydrolipoamide dehydrogenase (E3) component
MYERLFEPMKIGKLEIKNRFVVPAMDSHYTNEEHQFTQQALNYYGERALGGFGLIITEFLCVSEEGLAEKTQAGIYDDKFIPMLSQLVERVHQNGSCMFAQLQHSGRLQGKGTSDLKVVGASNIPDKSKPREVHELTTSEVKVIIQKFVDAAKRAKKAGFDGVEIHGAHGYLLAQFMSRGVNKRVDCYGGNITNRARIVCEIVEEIKKECGQDYPVIVRTSGDEGYYGGNTIEDAVAQAMLFEKAGADAINVSYGTAIQSYYVKNGFNIDNVKKVKDAVNVPVIGIGRINDPTLALSCLQTNAMDFVALGRQSICDSHFPNKVKENKINEILTCTGCMQRCLYTSSFEDGFGTSCMINPFSGKESIWTIEKVTENKKIAIIGAGVAGLQAGWILGKRGYNVTIYEKENFAGGQYRLASVPAMKQDLAKTISTYLVFNEKYNVNIQYNTTVTKELLDKENFDEIIVSTGSLPIIPRIAGIDNDNVFKANDILSFNKVLQNQKVLVLGAGLVGVETAEILAEYGNSVTVVDMLDKAAPLAPKRPRENLLAHLKQLNVEFILNSKVLQINKDGIDYENNNQTKSLTQFDSIILAFGSKPNNELYNQLNEYKNIHMIGDAFKAGDAKKAIYEATQLALTL